jgi:hypothetical protein
MEWWNAAFDHLCRFVYIVWTEFGWPHAALIIVFIVVKVFSVEIKIILKRINKLGPWAEFQPMTETKQPTVSPSEQEAGEGLDGKAMPQGSGLTLNLPAIPFPQSLSDIRASVINEISSLGEQDVRNYLIEHLSFWRVTADFEYISGVIYGGQLGFLRLLAERGVAGASVMEARGQWASFQPTIKPNFDGWSAEQYLNFLVLKGLVLFAGDMYYITPKGRELISWMSMYGRLLVRAL